MARSAPASADDATTTIRFEATVESLNGRRIMRLPDAASAALPSRGQLAVTGAIDDARFETVVEPDGRRGHWINLDAVRPLPKSLTDGQRAKLAIAPASEWPEPAVPDDLQAALDAASDIQDLWRDITPMARWEWVRWVGATANADTRARRVEVTISKLRDAKRRPCCFDLASCTVPELARSGKLIET